MSRESVSNSRNEEKNVRGRIRRLTERDGFGPSCFSLLLEGNRRRQNLWNVAGLGSRSISDGLSRRNWLSLFGSAENRCFMRQVHPERDAIQLFRLSAVHLRHQAAH